jgi:hypothetical protein
MMLRVQSPARLLSLSLTVLAGGAVAFALVWRQLHPPDVTAAPPARPTAPAPAREPFSMQPSVDQQATLAGELPRRILALHDSAEWIEEEDDHGRQRRRPIDAEVAMTHTLAELPLNHLGLVVEHRDVNRRPLPTPAEMSRYRGIVTWFGDERMRDPVTYLQWLIAEQRAGRRVVVIEHLGARQDLDGAPVPRELLQEAFAALGARFSGNATSDSGIISVVHADARMVGFERPLPARLDYYEGYRVEPGTRVYLRLERTDIRDSASDAVWTSERGGFIMPSVALTEDRLGTRYVRRWLVDPFRFFEEALAVQGWPRPDFTTLNGRRIFYSQIDGDGAEMTSELDYSSRCAAVVRDRVLEAYPLPFTASVVVGLTAPPPVGRGTPEDVAIMRSIFALDNVEVGSHGLAHPMNWRDGPRAELSVPGLPDYELGGETEIAASVAYIDKHLAPPGKPCRIMLWTGWCNPSEDQLAVAYRLGLRNMNGGDPRMDSHYPSYAHLVPPIHPVGKLFQFYTSAANDYILTDDWTPPYYRFQNVIKTFESTAEPRRIMPVDVYFHFYIARNQAALAGLLRVLDWVSEQPLAPLFTSEYVDLVRDFAWIRLARRGPRHWVVRKGRHLRTVRFDRADVHVDLAASRGVLGYLNVAALGATYVHLDDSPEASIVLREAPAQEPHLREASHRVERLRVREAGISFATAGPGARTFVFAGLPPGATYRLRLRRAGRELPAGGDPHKFGADQRGLLTVTLSAAAAAATSVELERTSEEPGG